MCCGDVRSEGAFFSVWQHALRMSTRLLMSVFYLHALFISAQGLGVPMGEVADHRAGYCGMGSTFMRRVLRGTKLSSFDDVFIFPSIFSRSSAHVIGAS
jgi:hypothetical protein